MNIFSLSTPTPVLLHDGRCVVASPLTEADLMGFLKHVQQERLTMFLRAIPRELPDKERQKMARIAMKEASHFEFTEYSVDPADIPIFIFLSLKKKNAVTLEQVREMCENPEDLDALLLAFTGPKPIKEDGAQKKSEEERTVVS